MKSSPAPRRAYCFKVEKFTEQKKLFFFLKRFGDEEKYSKRKICVYTVIIFNYLDTFLCYIIFWVNYILQVITRKLGYYYRFDFN